MLTGYFSWFAHQPFWIILLATLGAGIATLVTIHLLQLAFSDSLKEPAPGGGQLTQKTHGTNSPIATQETRGTNSPAIAAGRDVHFQTNIIQSANEGPHIAIEWVWETQGMSNYYYVNVGDDRALNPTLVIRIRDLEVRCLPPPGNLERNQRSPIFVSVPGIQPAKTLADYLASLQSSTGITGVQDWVDQGKHLLDVHALITFQDKNGEPWSTEWRITRNLLEHGHPPTVEPLGPKKKSVRGITPNHGKETKLSSDEKTLEELRKLLPNEGGIMQLRDQPFLSRFLWNADSILRSFLQMDSGPEHGFLDYDLEQIRGHLHKAVATLLDLVYRYSVELPEGTESGKFRYFSPLGKIEDMPAFDKRRNEVSEAARKVCSVYDDLVLTARRKFAGVAPPPIAVLQPPVKRPRVVASKYCRSDQGEQLLSGYREFLILSNDGDDSAHDARIESLRVGGWIIEFDRPPLITTLSPVRVNVKSISKTTWNEGTPHTQRSDYLDTAWRDAQKDGDLDKVPIRINYRTFDDKPFSTVCAMERDGSIRGDLPFVISDCRDTVVEVEDARPIGSGGQLY